MAVVTKIEQQKHRTDRYSIFIDGEYSFSVSANDLLASGLHSGQSITRFEIEKLESDSKQSKVHDQALNYLSFRPRSAREVSSHLVGKGHDATVVESVVVNLEQRGIINDAEFAGSWIRDRQALKPRSKRKLEQELRQKGLSSEVIAVALADVSEGEEQAAILSLAQKKLTLSRYQDSKKLTNYLVTQGFNYSLVKKVLSEIDNNVSSK